MNPDPSTLGRYVKSRGPSHAKVFIIAEAPGEEEEKWGMPAMGQPGRMLSEMLQEVGIDIRECFIAKVCRYKPPGSDIMNWIATKKAEVMADHQLIDGRYVLWPIAKGREELHEEIRRVRPNVILALGNLGLWSVTGKWGIQDWRGSLEIFEGIKVIPSFHPSAIIRQWEWRSLAMVDLRRVAEHSRSPDIPELVERFELAPTYDQALNRLTILLRWCDHAPTPIAFDIETRAGHIACIGFAWSAHDGFCLPLMDVSKFEGYWNVDEEAQLIWLVWKIMTHPNFVGIAQNGSYDCQYIQHHWGFMPHLVRDTLVQHHAMMPTGNTGDEEDKKKNPALKKSLGVLSSIYRKVHIYWKDQLDTWDDED